MGRITKGYYLALVPRSWEATRSAPVAAEPALNGEAAAHFVFAAAHDPNLPVFRTPDQSQSTVGAPPLDVTLVGHVLEDAHDIQGPLFGGTDPPLLVTNDWQEIHAIVIGRESTAPPRWRNRIKPPKGDEQLALSVLVNQGPGWYFVRFYDEHIDLIDSMDFRWAPGLREITVESDGVLPRATGHGHKCVRWRYEIALNIEPRDPSLSEVELIGPLECVATLKPIPESDLTYWAVRQAGMSHACQVIIAVEQVWWQLNVNCDDNKWQSKPMINEDSHFFRATSEVCLWIRMPLTGNFKSAFLGFARHNARKFPAAAGKVCVPLREFCDSQEVQNHREESRLQMWLDAHDPVDVLILPRDKAHERPCPVYEGFARFRSATAHARLLHTPGKASDPPVCVNGKSWTEYFECAPPRDRAFFEQLFKLDPGSPVLHELSVQIEVKGSQPNTRRQVRAAAHALARMLNAMPGCPNLRRLGYGGVAASRDGTS